jgi:predicted AAA+ superfamily ATPase
MHRDFSDFLVTWLDSERRKPLIVRGARQVGKTWLGRELARASGRTLLEVNFDRNPEYARIFREEGSGPRQWIDDLGLRTGVAASGGEMILFLDEIQSAPEVLAKLRWFAEEMPEVPVIAAGSLLEFALRDFEYSMPVGRVSYAFVEPVAFPEFLQAHGSGEAPSALEGLDPWKRSWRGGAGAGDGILRSLSHDGRHARGGGGGYRRGPSERVPTPPTRSAPDLPKRLCQYSGRMDRRILDDVLRGAVDQLGCKFVYSHVGGEVKHQQARRALELLCMAQLCDAIPHAACQGVPLAGNINERLQKVALLDVGLAHGIWNTPAGRAFPRWTDVAPALRGGLSEQGIAQQLRIAVGEPTRRGQLFHWRRENGRVGEIDLVLECGGLIVPVETKSGASGSMKSLHQFMHDKSLALAVRFDRNPPSIQRMQVKTTLGQAVDYQLLNLPHSLAWRTPRWWSP